MTINLLRTLSGFDVVDDRETDTAFFRTHVPWVAPEAYLNIIYKPAPAALLSQVAGRIRMPLPLFQFLAVQNGAHLFSSAIHIFGVINPTQLFDRTNSLCVPAFNLEIENSSTIDDPAEYLAIAAYGYDGTQVLMDRASGAVMSFAPDRASRLIWADMDEWIRREIRRLAAMFDARGKRLLDESQTVPPFCRSPN